MGIGKNYGRNKKHERPTEGITAKRDKMLRRAAKSKPTPAPAVTALRSRHERRWSSRAPLGHAPREVRLGCAVAPSRFRPPVVWRGLSAGWHLCSVCSGVTDDLICETCGARIRGEALERKIETERAGRRGAPA